MSDVESPLKINRYTRWLFIDRPTQSNDAQNSLFGHLFEIEDLHPSDRALGQQFMNQRHQKHEYICAHHVDVSTEKSYVSHSICLVELS